MASNTSKSKAIEPRESELTIKARLWPDGAMFMREVPARCTTPRGQDAEIAVNMMVGPTHDDAVCLVRVGDFTAALDNVSLVQAVDEAAYPEAEKGKCPPHKWATKPPGACVKCGIWQADVHPEPATTEA